MADIVINKWNQGMVEGPMLGFADMRNIDIYSQPGAIKVNQKLQLSSQTVITGAVFTVDTAADTLIFSSGHNLQTGSVILVSTTGTLPNPLTVSTNYYVTVVDALTIKLSTTLANAYNLVFINITTAGTGVQTAATRNIGRVRFFTENPATGYIYCVDDNGRVWYVGDFGNLWVLIDGNTLTNASGNGICVWKNYLFVFRNTAIDLYGGPTGGLSDAIANRVWNGPVGWPLSSTNTTGSHQAIWGVDDILYYCNRGTVGSFQEVGAFTGIAGTYTQTSGALVLPSSYTAWRLEELGENLLVGANIGQNSNVNSVIFPWDRTSSSFFLPIKLPFFMQAFFVYNNILYIFSTNALKIITLNGSYLSDKKRLPPAALMNDISANTATGGVGFYQGRLIFSMYGRTNFSAIYSLIAQPSEYFSYSSFLIENTISTGSSSSTVQTLGIHVPRGIGNYYAAWYDSSLGYGGIDSILGVIGTATTYSNYEASVQSELLVIGNPLKKRTLSQIDIFLTKPLTASQGIKLYYRTDINASYTLINTYDFATLGSVTTINERQNFGVQTDIIQIKIEMTAGNGTTTSPELFEIRLR